ncbi:phosphatase PAP2 family protein [Corynebacterium doosanense]|uniref:phosphatase PAP2 family protein n=1 Tax=Corynebacterium doosanense TaxID=1121358 RepID=UPI00138AD452|nr:phosphatase PAP2 family protein [Corynebacterium doosanense]
MLGWLVASRIDALSPLIAAFSELSRPAYLLLYALVLALGQGIRRRPQWAQWWVLPPAILVTNGLVHALKALIGRARPPAEFQLGQVSGDSFPSGHAAGAAVVAVLVSLLCARWWARAAVWIWAVAVMVSRLYLGVHWLSDVLAGAVLGAVVGVVCWVTAGRVRTALGERQVNN